MQWWRPAGILMAMIGFGMVGASPVAAQEVCRPDGRLAIVDGNGDGVVTQSEVQAVVDSLGDAEGIENLQAVVNTWPANVTGIRYTGCTADGGGDTGNGGGTGNNGGGTGGGTGDGSGTGGGTGDGSGTGTGDGSGTGEGTGDGSGTGTAGGTGDGSGTGNPTTIVMIDGTPVVVDTVTGLPATGQGEGSASSANSAATIAFLSLAVVALASAGTLIGRTRRTSKD
jgi:hypothetical protein